MNNSETETQEIINRLGIVKYLVRCECRSTIKEISQILFCDSLDVALEYMSYPLGTIDDLQNEERQSYYSFGTRYIADIAIETKRRE